MKRLQHLWLWMAVLVGVAAFATITPRVSASDVIIHIGPGSAPVAEAPVYHYVYYPEQEVYFVPETRVYWWSDGGEWHSGPHAPSGIALGTSVNLDVDARDPWRHHDVIIQKFPRTKHEERRERREERREEKREHDND